MKVCSIPQCGKKVKSRGWCNMHHHRFRRFGDPLKCVRESTRHGGCGTKLHRVWMAIIERCSNKNHEYFSRYGGRGITVCERWKNFSNFRDDTGEQPHGMTVERVDNNLGYFPETGAASNCCCVRRESAVRQDLACRNRRRASGAAMTYRAWICEGCKRGQIFRGNIWDCPGCNKEICDDCGWMLGHCKPCCEGKEPEALRVVANLHGFDFEPDCAAITMSRDA